MKAIIMRSEGGPEVLEWVELPAPIPKADEVLVRISVVGVNFMDTGVRKGLFWQEGVSKQIGVEGAGVVAAVGEEVKSFKPGDRVAWAYRRGSYAELITIAATELVAVPRAISDHEAAAVLTQGITASHFTTDFYPVKAGETALVHAAAGGLGMLITQMIKFRGGKVIGIVSNEEKAPAAREAGVDHVIVNSDGSFAPEVVQLTQGRGVDVVYDGSGPTTFQGSMDALRRSGTFCWYGTVLGAQMPLVLSSLPKSIKIGYATFRDHIYTPELFQKRAGQLFNWILEGKLKITIGGVYAMADAAVAHEDMENRKTTGKLLLVPDSSRPQGRVNNLPSNRSQ